MIHTDQVAVTDVAVQVIPAPLGAVITQTDVSLVNQGSSTVYLGGADVDSDHGFRLLAGAGWSVELAQPTDLYAVCASGQTSTLDVILERTS